VTVVATGLHRAGMRQPLTVIQTPQQGQRTGTDNMPFIPTLNDPVSMGNRVMPGTAMGSGSVSMGDTSVPTVWRTRDRTSAAAKVDALSSGGMDDFEIPAFLRKQAD